MKLSEILEKYQVSEAEVAEALYAWLAQFDEEHELMDALVDFLKQ